VGNNGYWVCSFGEKLKVDGIQESDILEVACRDEVICEWSFRNQGKIWVIEVLDKYGSGAKMDDEVNG